MFHFLNLQNLFYRIYTWLFSPDLFGDSTGVGGAGLNGTGGGSGVAGTAGTDGGGSLIFLQFLVLLKLLFIFLGFACLVGAVYAAVRLHQVRKKTRFVFAQAGSETPRAPKQDQWEFIQKNVGSENSSDWKLAILDADSMLDELLIARRIPGDTLGERLKSADPADFRTLDDAWEAHKLRNRIAHEGLNFALSKREARIAVERYERVFREFGLVA